VLDEAAEKASQSEVREMLERGVGIWASFVVTGAVDTNDSASVGMSSLRAGVPPALMLRA
jgi:hypothetical protein